MSLDFLIFSRVISNSYSNSDDSASDDDSTSELVALTEFIFERRNLTSGSIKNSIIIQL